MDAIKTKAQELLKSHDLDFEIHKLPLSSQFDGEVVASKYYGLYNEKSGEIINTVKGSYTISQNLEIMEAVLRGAQKYGNLTVSAAHSFNGGRRTYIGLKIEGKSKVGNDTVERYITIIDSNDGSSGLLIGIGDYTISCQNIFHSFEEDGRMKARHTSSLSQKIATIDKMIERQLDASMRMMELYSKFQSTAVSRELAHQMVDHLLGFSKKTSKTELEEISARSLNAMDSLYSNIENEMNSKGDNVWGLHSGVTRWTTHDKSAPRRENGRLESSAVGTNYRTNQASLKFAKELVL
jgi:hypothetical protein